MVNRMKTFADARTSYTKTHDQTVLSNIYLLNFAINPKWTSLFSHN